MLPGTTIQNRKANPRKNHPEQERQYPRWIPCKLLQYLYPTRRESGTHPNLRPFLEKKEKKHGKQAAPELDTE
jgi:hypothetical protein